VLLTLGVMLNWMQCNSMFSSIIVSMFINVFELYVILHFAVVGNMNMKLNFSVSRA